MNKWLIVHSLDSYSENNRMLGFPAKTELDGKISMDEKNKPIPAFEKIINIKKGDHIVYYCKGDYVIKGIFKVIHSHFAKEKRWKRSPFQFEIDPIIELEDPYNFKLLLSSLDLFSHLTNLENWGRSLQGKYNSIKQLTEHDYKLIKKSIVHANEDIEEYEEEADIDLSDYRRHLQLQYQIADWGLKNGYRVHIAINDKKKIKEKLSNILNDIPKFHSDEIVKIAKRIDVLFFEKERNILTHAFEVEHTTDIYSGLLRLNDIVVSYPADNVKFFIISKEKNEEKFNRELERPSFNLLRKLECSFLNYKEVDEEWKEILNRKPPKF